MRHAKPYYISPAFAFVAYPNRDSTPFREWYKIDGEGEGETVVRGTLRYQGFPEFIAVLVQLGWLDGEEKAWLKQAAEEKWSLARVMQKVLGADDDKERSVGFCTSVENCRDDSSFL
jgi:spermidine synthase / saccharopine dehydrogenase (NADP+, L-glutamate-forming)